MYYKYHFHFYFRWGCNGNPQAVLTTGIGIQHDNVELYFPFINRYWTEEAV